MRQVSSGIGALATCFFVGIACSSSDGEEGGSGGSGMGGETATGGSGMGGETASGGSGMGGETASGGSGVGGETASGGTGAGAAASGSGGLTDSGDGGAGSCSDTTQNFGVSSSTAWTQLGTEEDTGSSSLPQGARAERGAFVVEPPCDVFVVAENDFEWSLHRAALPEPFTEVGSIIPDFRSNAAVSYVERFGDDILAVFVPQEGEPSYQLPLDGGEASALGDANQDVTSVAHFGDVLYATIGSQLWRGDAAELFDGPTDTAAGLDLSSGGGALRVMRFGDDLVLSSNAFSASLIDRACADALFDAEAGGELDSCETETFTQGTQLNEIDALVTNIDGTLSVRLPEGSDTVTASLGGRDRLHAGVRVDDALYLAVSSEREEDSEFVRVTSLDGAPTVEESALPELPGSYRDAWVQDMWTDGELMLVLVTKSSTSQRTALFGVLLP